MKDFSLVAGGPLYQLLMRLGLSSPDLGLLKRRIICLTLFAYLPLFLISLFEGKAWGGVTMPFMYDIEAQSRFLIALPLLIAAELFVHKRVHHMVSQFIEQGVITEQVLPRYREIIATAMKLRNSVVVELMLFILLFAIGHSLWNTFSILDTIAKDGGSWFAGTDATGTHPTIAGYWYIFISRPLFQFILFRWYFRICIWALFLWRVSRLKLQLIPTHPDRSGGIGFLGLIVGVFLLLILAHGVLLGGMLANMIYFIGGKLPDYLLLILGVVLFVFLIVLGPLLAFAPALMRARHKGIYDYGILASEYVSEFDAKWVRGKADEKLLGTSDIQSLADLANSFQVIESIKPFPFGKEALFQLIIFTLLPVLPLVLTMVPLEELIKKFFGFIF
jgi:hypothetical protein